MTQINLPSTLRALPNAEAIFAMHNCSLTLSQLPAPPAREC